MTGSGIIQGLGARIVVLLALGLLTVGCAEKSVDQLLADAKQDRDRGHYRTAIVHLKNVLEKAPQNAEARYLMGVTLNDMGDFTSAEIELRKAIDLRYELAKVKIGKSLLMMGQYQKVLDQIPPDSNVSDTVQAEILTLRAMALFGVGRRQEGRESLAQAFARQPEFADALLVQAMIAAGERQLDAASQFIERAIASAPKNVDAWLMKGNLAGFKNDLAGAAAAYRKVLEISPENVPARVRITHLQLDAGNFDDARKELEQLRKIAPNLPQTKFLLALSEFRQKKYTAAREAVLQLLKASPDHLQGMLLAGAIEFQLGAHSQSQAHLAQVIERAPGNIPARKLLAASLAKNGQVQRALEVLRPALQEAPGDHDLMGLAGEIYLTGNEPAKALEYFERAAKLDPKSATARIGLGLSWLAAGETDRALAALESAVQLDPDRYRADLLLVMTHLQRANYDQALQAMQSLEKKQPKNPLTYNLKGMIYTAKKDEATARKHLEHALELNSTYVPAAVNLARLDLQAKRPEVARRRLEAILNKDKNNTEALLALAKLAPSLGVTSKERIDWLERARLASPGSVQPALMLALAYAQSGDVKKALESAQQAQTAHPNSVEVLETLAILQKAAGATEQALVTYNKLAALQPNSAITLYRLAVAQVANADRNGAANTLRKAVSLQPDLLEAQVMLGSLELQAGRYPAAMKIAQLVQKQAATSAAGFILEGDIRMKEKNFPQAVKAYETAYDMSKNGMALVKLHQAYARSGKGEEGEAKLARALKEAPDDAGIRTYIAENSIRNGKYKDAIEQYEWLLKKQPDNAALTSNLAWAYWQVKDTRALDTAERAYKLNPGNAAAADTLGWILVEQGNTKRGIELLQKAVTSAPKVSEHRYHLARALMKAGDRTKAREELEILLKNAPRSRFAAEAKQLLAELRQ